MPQPPAIVDSQFEQVLRWGLNASADCAIGVLIGVLLARTLRRRNLHWSWAAVPLLPLGLAGTGIGVHTGTLLLACVTASARGRRWHRQDRAAGADLAGLAAERTRPRDVLEGALRRAALRRLHGARSAAWVVRGQLLLGTDARSHPVRIPFDSAGGGVHTLTVGATGSGKTVTQAWIAVRSISHGMGAIVIDPKGDHAMREQLAAAAHASGRRLIEWRPDGRTVYNPYARGSDTEIADKVLAGERFTEPHYLRQAQRYIGHAVRAMRSSGIEVSLQGIVAQLDPERLERLVRDLPEADADATHAYLDSLTARQRSDLAGVRDRLAILTESDVGRWLDPRTRGTRFDLLDAVQRRSVVYFNLEADSRPLLAQMLGAAIVQDLQTAVASLQGAPVATLIVIDEFSALAAEQIVRLFGRARSAGFSLVLGTQELSDLRPPGRERLLEQVMGNLSTLIVHRQVVPASAELVASVAGMRGAWRVSHHSDGRSTRTRTREPVMSADHVMALETGDAAVIVLTAGRSARTARILSPALDA
ncbi:MAG: conjugal transfer pilus assembly protein TraD [Solirubrobacteraceae bacterium]|nr:conjugal transfer pilus assembly protein TraD [Solirubrobacteraceae bacterium]